ncbi:ROK family protein [bacterium SCSIO 12696]|nr:ROK family protein [bacterium SCSIO 12696]
MHYGVDVGGTKIELALFDESLQPVDSWRVPTPKHDYAEFVDTIVGMVERADALTGVKGSVGIGIPGFFDANENTVAVNIPGIHGRPLSVDLCARLARPVVFENDVNTLALSEAHGGALAGHTYAMGVVLGTGVAGGFVANGQLCKGSQHIACELGHLPLSARLQQKYDLPLRDCGCGLQGCIENYLSGPGLGWMCQYFESGYNSPESMAEGLRRKEPKAQQVFDIYVDCLGCFLAQVTLSYDPGAIALAGGLSNLAEIYPRIGESMSRYLFSAAKPPAVVPAQFGDSSGVRGAALLGLQAMESG